MILILPVLAGMGRPEGGKSPGTGQTGFIIITVESNINRIFFKYYIRDWCLSVPGVTRTSFGNDSSVSVIKVRVKDFKSTSLFVSRDFLNLMKADEFPYLEIAILQNRGIVYHPDGIYLLKDVSITVAGVSRKYDIVCRIDNIDNECQILNGTLRLKLTDLKIDPPVKLSGLVKVRNEIIVNFGFCIRNTGVATV
ncbi:MAG TPA: hypothetical protein DDW27_05830 [Bacteroidales bacterium]|nr:hypothetical protein [Bacteroidales bacterium]